MLLPEIAWFQHPSVVHLRQHLIAVSQKLFNNEGAELIGRELYGSRHPRTTGKGPDTVIGSMTILSDGDVERPAIRLYEQIFGLCDGKIANHPLNDVERFGFLRFLNQVCHLRRPTIGAVGALLPIGVELGGVLA